MAERKTDNLPHEENVRTTTVAKTFQVTDKVWISLRAEEIAVYKLRRKKGQARGRAKPVYTLLVEEWRRTLPVLEKLIKRYS